MTTALDPALDAAVDDADALAERLLGAAVEAMDLLAVTVGDRLGYYRALADGPLDAATLASRTGTDARYAREWLEQQTVTGLLEEAGGEFAMPAATRAVLADADDLRFLAPLARQVCAAAAQVRRVADGARSGAGLPWSAFGPEMRESEADLNRPGYLGSMREWLDAAGVLADLERTATARVADVGCGAAWSTVGLARALPRASVDGYDIDAESVTLARRVVEDAGLADRVRVLEQDVADLAPADRYDLVTLFECLHDLPHPVESLGAVRRMLAPGGRVLVADMKVADAFGAVGDPVERLMYGYSVTVCLPDSMSTPGSARTGTVLRPDALRALAVRAGFAAEPLPVEHDLWRFWLLEPR